MTYFSELISKRRSIRNFTANLLTGEQVELILKAALKAPTSKNGKSWEFLVIEDKKKLEKLSFCKKTGSKPIASCVLAIIVLGNPFVSDVWVEDTSIASILMQLQAEDLGLGSCWIQIRKRMTAADTSSEEYIKDLFDVPMQMRVLSVIALGYKETEKTPLDEENLLWEKVHIDKY